MSQQNTIFPEISSNIWLTVILTSFLMFALYLGQGGTLREGPDAFTTFALTGVLILVIGVQQASRNQDPLDAFIKATGFKSPLPGFNFLLACVGIGIGLLTFNITNTAMSIWGGNPQYASLITPLYNSFNAFPTEFALTTPYGEVFQVAVFQFAVIATGEEIFKIFAAKNTSNWLYSKKGLNKGTAITLGILFALLFWSVWHFLSWTLTIGAIFAALLYGIVFYLPWLLSDFVGSINPDQRITLTEIPSPPAIGAHGTWNTLITIGGTGLGFTTNTVMGLTLVIVPTIIMLSIKKRFEIPFFPENG